MECLRRLLYLKSPITKYKLLFPRSQYIKIVRSIKLECKFVMIFIKKIVPCAYYLNTVLVTY